MKKKTLMKKKTKAEDTEIKEVTNEVEEKVIFAKIERYTQLSEIEKATKTEKTQLSTELKKFAVDNGIEDEKGSSYFIKDNKTVGNVIKVSTSLDEEKAIKLLKKKKLDEAIVTVEKVDEEKLANLVNDKKITLKEYESIIDRKVSYSISVKVVEEDEEMPEVEKTKVKTKKAPLNKRK